MRKLIIHAAELATCAGTQAKRGAEMSDIGLIRDGAVLIEDETIKKVGTTQEVLAWLGTAEGAGSGQNAGGAQTAGIPADIEVIDASGLTVLPGFVDSHTHFIFGGYRADEFSWRLRGDSYMSIMERGGGINATVTKTRAASLEELKESGKDRLKTMLAFGVTTVEGKSGYGLDTETELRQLQAMKELEEEQPLEIVRTFLGPHSVLPEYKGKEREFLDLMLNETMPLVREQGLAQFADIFTEKNVFDIADSEYYLNRAKEMGFDLKIHADEMYCLGGASLAARTGCVSADHLLKAGEEGIKALAGSSTIATLLPATAFCLGEEYADARAMIDAGCAVALASDVNPGSCFTNSIPLLTALGCIYMHMSVEEVITALTINGAAAVGRADRIGSIQEGKQADIIFLKYPSIHYIPYNTAMNLTCRVIKKGKVVWEG